MAENTKIQWATHTWNPWLGCSPVHTGCQNCYAAAGPIGRLKAKWGPAGTRVKTSDEYWRQPLKWQRAAERAFREYAPERPRIFPSACDPFEDWDGVIYDHRGDILTHGPGPHGIGAARVPPKVTMDYLRREFFHLIDDTPNLNWLLVTKRPENIRRMMSSWLKERCGPESPADSMLPITNVWLGASVSDQQTYDTLAHSLYYGCRDLTPVLFLSIEPLVGPIKLWHEYDGEYTRNWRGCFDWVVVGGESGPHARPCHIEWIADIVQQCRDAGVACFVKQLGADPWCDTQPSWASDWESIDGLYAIQLNHPKGGDPAEWPRSLCVREFPIGYRNWPGEG